MFSFSSVLSVIPILESASIMYIKVSLPSLTFFSCTIFECLLIRKLSIVLASFIDNEINPDPAAQLVSLIKVLVVVVSYFPAKGIVLESEATAPINSLLGFTFLSKGLAVGYFFKKL